MGDKSKYSIVAVSGSVRPNNYTWMALQLVVDELKKHERVNVEVFDPRELALAPPGTGTDDPGVEAFKATVEKATGVILATPEYHGGMSSVIKLVIENLGFPSVLAGKPVALLGVAAGQIGAIKSLEMLRSVCSHIGAVVLPSTVSIAGVRKVFDEKGHCTDEKIEQRVRGVATTLIDYIEDNICPRVALESMVRSD